MSESSSKPGKRVSKLTIATLLFGLILAVVFIYGRYCTYLNGQQMKSGTFDSIVPILVMLSCGAMFAVCGIAAFIRAVMRKGLQPLVAAIVVTGLIVAVDFIPMPSYMDGVALTLSRQDEKFYQDLEQRLSNLPKRSSSDSWPTIPDSWFNELPGLAAIFPSHKKPWWKPRIFTKETHFDVIVGGSLAGTTGIRIYRTNETPLHLIATEYVGSFREIYPRVYAYQQYY
ncbi:MAG: hypothetical protein EOP84_06040 [Verrucomicrobiaceae bacterium]|nr:MAG: hypothetical protein EOP84_06040 [Verrucomicrobiaceae bacterium]